MQRTLPRFDFRVAYAAVTDVGRVRTNNEDVFRVEPDLALFSVADGMGGHAAGEVAAELASSALVERVGQRRARRASEAYLSTPTLEARRQVFAVLRDAVEHANAQVRRSAEQNPDRAGMGCTLDAVLLLHDRAFVVHVGDSRVYLARPSTTIQLTHDHSLHDALLAQGAVGRNTPEPSYNPLINAIGLSPEVQVDGLFVDLARGDRLILCTDGVHGLLPTEAELSLLARTGSADEAAEALVGAALERGGRDNATAIVVDIGERFVTRGGDDEGLKARDIATVRGCPLLHDLPPATLLRALSAAVEIEFRAAEPLPRTVASDQVAYIVLEGEVRLSDGRLFGAAALLYPESLVGGFRDAPPCRAERHVRALRLRADDFKEVCEGNMTLAAQLYERLARLLARAQNA